MLIQLLLHYISIFRQFFYCHALFFTVHLRKRKVVISAWRFSFKSILFFFSISMECAVWGKLVMIWSYIEVKFLSKILFALFDLFDFSTFKLFLNRGQSRSSSWKLSVYIELNNCVYKHIYVYNCIDIILIQYHLHIKCIPFMR